MPGQTPTLSEFEELLSDHEEADTRIMSHGVHASTTVSSVVISSPDTDVAILAIAHHSKFACTNVAILTGSKDKWRLLSVNHIADQLGCKVTNGLIGLHSYTGCDAVSSFVGEGKASAFKLLKEN